MEGAKRQNAKLIAKKSSISREVPTAYCTKYEHSSELPIRTDISVALLLFANIFSCYLQLLFSVMALLLFFRFGELTALTEGL